MTRGAGPLWTSVTGLALTVAMYAGGWVLGASREPLEGFEAFSWPDAIWPIPFLGFSLVGAVVAARRSDNPIGWLFLGTGALMLFNFFSQQYALSAFSGTFSLGGADLMAWFSMWTWISAVGMITAFFLLFPTGHAPSPRWTWVLRAVVVVHLAVPVAAARVSPELGVELLRAANPGELPRGEWLNHVANGGAPLLILSGIASLVVRFWRSRAEERQQLKLFSSAGVLLALTLVAMFAFGGEDPIKVPALALANTIALVSLPVAAGISILRYRLYDIDLVINRAVVYAVLTGCLALAYLGSVVVLQGILAPATRDSDLAVAGSTLAVAALFRPLRARIQSFIDRRFYRRKYDAAETLSRFSSRLRDEIDLDSLSNELVGVVRSTMQPAHASIWLRDRSIAERRDLGSLSDELVSAVAITMQPARAALWLAAPKQNTRSEETDVG